MKTNVVVTNNN